MTVKYAETSAPPAPVQRASQPTTTIYLMRHGEPEAEWLNCYYGQMDVPLSEKGRAQSRALAERLTTVPFDAVYSSDLERAGYLADRLAETRDLPVRRLTVLRERHMGRLQGIKIEELQQGEHVEIYQQWLADRINFRVPEAENFIDLGQRIVPAIEELAAAFAGRRVAVAGHAGPIRVMLAHVLGLPLDNIFRLGVNHCSIHVIEFNHGGPARLTLMNG